MKFFKKLDWGAFRKFYNFNKISATISIRRTGLETVIILGMGAGKELEVYQTTMGELMEADIGIPEKGAVGKFAN